MSASKKKLAQQEANKAALAEREQKRQEQAQANRRNSMIYAGIGAVVAALAIVAIVWNSGMIQRSATAVSINETDYTAPAVQYYVNNAMQQYSFIVDSNNSMKSTVMDAETGYTVFDFMLDMAEDSMLTSTAVSDHAKAAGYTLPASIQTSLDSTLANLDETAANMGYANADAFLRSNFGPYMDRELFAQLLTQETLVQNYISETVYGIEYSDSEYDAYYEANKNSLDTYTMTQFVFQARVATTDANGNTIEMTEDEKAAALEAAKAEQKALAEELMAKLKSGEKAADLAKEYGADLYNYEISVSELGSLVNTAYSEWAFDSARKNGDITLAEYDSTTAYNYYVARFEGRERNEDPTHDVRHILVSDKAMAESLLTVWEGGDRSETSFAALASQYSEDTNSATNGGLIADITEQSNYVDSFKDWALDPSRKDGDTGLVESSYGWHVMYYHEGAPVWKETSDSVLRNQDYVEWLDEICADYAPVRGFGIKFIQG